MVDYICQYLSTVRERRVTPDVRPGYLRAQLPESAPEEPESWDSIFGDIERIIMPGVRGSHHKKRFWVSGHGVGGRHEERPSGMTLQPLGHHPSPTSGPVEGQDFD